MLVSFAMVRTIDERTSRSGDLIAARRVRCATARPPVSNGTGPPASIAAMTTVAAVPPEVERRHLALLRAFMSLEVPRSVLSAIAGVGVVAFVALVVDRLRPGPAVLTVAFVVSVVAFVVVTYGLATLMRPRRVARAFEVYRWVGRQDWLDWRRRAGRRVPQSRQAARAWLDMELRRPDSAVRDPLPRIEVYVWLGDLDDAMRAARSLPTDRPWDRFERDLMCAFVAFVAGEDPIGAASLADARLSAEQLSGAERRLATAKLAVEEARRLAANEANATAGAARASARTSGGATRSERTSADVDWLAPLVDVRERLGPSLDGFLVRDLARWALPLLLLIGVLSTATSFWVAAIL
jgi:hypothetical protein